ncbi:MAG: succinyl-diaminopimelate desuccinylase [Alphaproteobacteria bacterium]|nr:succinyl-diaminopimelate desuccinylase [Alphaproteobacteria bacterium]
MKLTQDLIALPSITPFEAGTLDLCQHHLESLGFVCERFVFSQEGTPDVDNLFAKFGTNAPHLCFLGHLDVVPPGDSTLWTYPPFDPHISNGLLYGRGVADMKGCVASFIASLHSFIKSKSFNGSISLILTCDEEGPAINGTKKVLDHLIKRGEKFDACLVGEPSCPTYLGESLKIGRRGSLNGKVTFCGKQGHVAYPQLAHNPIPEMIGFLDQLSSIEWDQGTEHFQPTNLEITSIDVNNKAYNVIPAKIEAQFNIRFNTLHNSESLKKHIQGLTNDPDDKFQWQASGEAFYTQSETIAQILQESCHQVLGHRPTYSTTGGTSDARFIHIHCSVIEFGLVNKTIHQIDECASIDDIYKLKDVYHQFLVNYFS